MSLLRTLLVGVGAAGQTRQAAIGKGKARGVVYVLQMLWKVPDAAALRLELVPNVFGKITLEVQLWDAICGHV